MGKDRPIGLIEILWDSIRAIQGDRSAQYRMVAGFRASQDVISWDSIVTGIPRYINCSQKSRNRHFPETTLRPCKLKAQGAPRQVCGTAVKGLLDCTAISPRARVEVFEESRENDSSTGFLLIMQGQPDGIG